MKRNQIKTKFLSCLLIIVMLVTFLSINVFAVTDEEAYAGNQLMSLGILKGYSDGSLQLDKSIARAEVATLIVRMISDEDQVILGEERDFSDVEKTYWAYNNIQNAYKLGIIKGYPSGEFKPLNHITYAEVVSIMVNTVGKGNDLEGNWPDNYINKAKELNIIPSNSDVDPSEIVTRGEMAVIVWDTLLVKKDY